MATTGHESDVDSGEYASPDPTPAPRDQDDAGIESRSSDPRAWDGSWLIGWHQVGVLIAALAVVVGIGAVAGELLTNWGSPNPITRFDDRVADAFVDGRTALLNDVVPWAAFPADTFTKIGISAVICGFFLWRWRRWDEAVYVALPLVFEATAFMAITTIVQRPRPDVERLLESTIDSSFPSGHVAAATVYAAVVVIVFRHTVNRWARGTAVAIFALIVAAVAWARLYQGMHYLSDVVGGVVLGAVALVITDRVLHRAALRDDQPHPGLGVPEASARVRIPRRRSPDRTAQGRIPDSSAI
jgi:membrane-associated phospholipid phosphatase